MSKSDQCNFTKVVRRANTRTQAHMLCFYRKTFCDPHYMFLPSNNNGLSISIKISWVIKNLKISVDSAFSFLAIEPKRKGGIRRISRKLISEEHKVTKTTFVAKNRLWIHLSINFTPKYEQEEISSSIEGEEILESRALF